MIFYKKKISELRSDIEARDICLETFKIGKSTSNESSQHSETINAFKEEIESLKLKESTTWE